MGAIVLLLLLIGRWQRSWGYVYAAGGAGLVALCWPAAARLLSGWWMALAKAIGAVTGRLLLLLVFGLILLPVAVVARWRGWLGMDLTAGKPTYYSNRDHLYSPSDLEQPW